MSKLRLVTQGVDLLIVKDTNKLILHGTQFICISLSVIHNSSFVLHIVEQKEKKNTKKQQRTKKKRNVISLSINQVIYHLLQPIILYHCSEKLEKKTKQQKRETSYFLYMGHYTRHCSIMHY